MHICPSLIGYGRGWDLCVLFNGENSLNEFVKYGKIITLIQLKNYMYFFLKN